MPRVYFGIFLKRYPIGNLWGFFFLTGHIEDTKSVEFASAISSTLTPIFA